MGRSIELVKPGSTLVAIPRQSESFIDGERIILVDGIRWGRTVVTRHGSQGTRTFFVQEGGGRVSLPGPRYGREVYVRSANPRHARRVIGGHYTLPPDFKSTAQLVLDKVIELVNEGMLRDPVLVRSEAAKRQAEYDRRVAAGAEKERQAFRKRAEGVLVQVFAGNHEEQIAAVIDAMKWAQDQ